MAKLGSKKHPAVVHVRTMERASEIVALCDKHGWQVIAGVEADKPENISDIKALLNMEYEPKEYDSLTDNIKIAPNNYCPCGSGLKFKKCCMNKNLEK